MNRATKSQAGERSALKYQLDLARETLSKLRKLNDVQTSETNGITAPPEIQKHEEYKRKVVSMENFTQRSFNGNALCEEDESYFRYEQPASAQEIALPDKSKQNAYKEEKHERLVKALGLQLSELEDSFKIALLKYFDQVEEQKEELIHGFELMQEQLIQHEQHCFMMSVESERSLDKIQNSSKHEFKLLQMELQRAMEAKHACAEENSRLREELRAQQYQVAMGELPVREPTDEVIRLQNKISAQDKICDAFTNDVAVKKNEIISLKAEKKELANELRAVYDELSEVETLQTERERQRNRTDKELESSKETIRYLQSQLRAASEEKLHLLSRIEEANCHSNENTVKIEHENRIHELNEKCGRVMQELSSKEKRVLEKETETIIMGKENADLKTALQQMQNTVNALKRQREDTDSELLKVKQKNLDMKTEHEKEQNKMFELQQELARAKGKISALESTSGEMRSRDESNREELERGKNQVDEIREELHISRNKVESVQNDLVNCENQRNKLYNETISLQGKVMQLEKSNADLRVEKAELERDFSHASKKLPKLEEIYRKLEKENEQLLKDFQESKENGSRLEKDLGKERAHRSKLQTKVSLLADSLQTSEKQLKEAQTELLKLHNCNDELTDRVLKGETENKYLKAVNKSLEQQIEKLRGTMRETEIENEVMKRDMKRLEKELKERDGKMTISQGGELSHAQRPRNHNDNTDPEYNGNVSVPYKLSFDAENGRPVRAQAEELAAVIPVLERENKELRNRERELMVQMMEKDRDSCALVLENGNAKMNIERQEEKIGKLTREIESLKGNEMKRERERQEEKAEIKKMITEKENVEKNRKDVGTNTVGTVDVREDNSTSEQIVITEKQQVCNEVPEIALRDQEMENLVMKLNEMEKENMLLKSKEDTLEKNVQQLKLEEERLKAENENLKVKMDKDSSRELEDKEIRRKMVEMESVLEDSNNEVQDVRKQKKEVQKELVEVKENLNMMEGTCEILKKENEQSRENENALRQKIRELEITYEDAEANMKEMQKRKEKIEKDMKIAEARLAEMENSYQERTQENEQLKENELKLKQAIRQLKSDLEDSRAELESVHKQRNKQTKELDDIMSKTGVMVGDYELLKEENDKLKDKENKLKKFIQEQEEDLADVKMKLKNTSKEKQSLAKDLQDIKDIVKKTTEQSDLLEKERDELKQKERASKNANKELEGMIEELNLELHNIENVKRTQEEELKECRRALQLLENKYQLLEQESERLRAHQEEEQNRTDLQLENETLNKNLQVAHESILELETAYKVAQERSQLFEEMNDEANKKIKELETEKHSTQDGLQRLQNDCEVANRKVKDLEKEVTDAREKCNDLEMQVHLLSEEKDSCEGEKKKAEEQLAITEENLADMEIEMQNLHDNQEAMLDDVDALKGQVEDLEKRNKTLKEQKRGVEEELDEAHDKITELRTKLKNKEEEAEMLEDEIQSLQANVRQLPTQEEESVLDVTESEELREELMATSKKVWELEASNETYQKDIEELENSLSAANEKILEVENELDSISRDYADIQGQYEDINNKLKIAKNERQAAEQRTAEQREMCNTYRKTLSEKDETIREMKQGRDLLEESIQALKRDSNTKDNSIKTLNDKLSVQEEELAKTTKSLKDLEAVHKNCEQIANVRAEQLSSTAPGKLSGNKGKHSSTPYHSKINSLHGDIQTNSIQVEDLSEKLSSAQKKMINLENELKKDLRKFERKHNGYSSDPWEEYDRPRRRRSNDYESELDELRVPRRSDDRRSSDSPIGTPTMGRRNHTREPKVKDTRKKGRKLPNEPIENDSRPTSAENKKDRSMTIPISDPFGNGTDVFGDDSELDSEASDWIKQNPFDTDADSVFSISQDESLNTSMNESKITQPATTNPKDWHNDAFSSSFEDTTDEIIITEKSSPKLGNNDVKVNPKKDATQSKDYYPVLSENYLIDQKSQYNSSSIDPFLDLDPFAPSVREGKPSDEESLAPVTSPTSPWSVHSDEVSSLGQSRDSDDDIGLGARTRKQNGDEDSDQGTLIYLSSDNESISENREIRARPAVPPKPKSTIMDHKNLKELEINVDVPENTEQETQWSPGRDRVSKLVKSFENSKQSWL